MYTGPKVSLYSNIYQTFLNYVLIRKSKKRRLSNFGILNIWLDYDIVWVM